MWCFSMNIKRGETLKNCFGTSEGMFITFLNILGCYNWGNEQFPHHGWWHVISIRVHIWRVHFRFGCFVCIESTHFRFWCFMRIETTHFRFGCFLRIQIAYVRFGCFIRIETTHFRFGCFIRIDLGVLYTETTKFRFGCFIRIETIHFRFGCFLL